MRGGKKNFGAAQPSSAPEQSGDGIGPLEPPRPPGLTPLSSGGPYFLPWTRERAEILHRLFTRVEVLREQGLSVRIALRRRWYGPRFHSARRIRVRWSTSSLVGLFYKWRKGGKTPECLALHYLSKLAPVPPEVARAFVVACGAAGVTHFSQAFRRIDPKGFSYRRVLAVVPDQVLRAIRDTFAARRQAASEAREREKGFQAQTHRATAADKVRGQRLTRLANSLIGRRGGSGVESTSLTGSRPVQPTGAIFKPVLRGVVK